MMDDDRVISPGDNGEDFVVEASLRPKTMDEYIGQPAMREKLGIFLEAARRRKEALDHTLIFGPPFIITEEQIDDMLGIIDETLAVVEKRVGI